MPNLRARRDAAKAAAKPENNARALLLEPKLMMIDEPSIGLSPILVNELFATLTGMRDRGITVLMIEQTPSARWKSPTTASCWSSAAPASPTPRRRSSPIRASGSFFWVVGWKATPPDKK